MATLRALKFLVLGPLILAMLVVINVMTSPGVWWVQWAALGIGIAWVISLLQVIRAMIIAGGIAALGALVYAAWRGSRRDAPSIATAPPPISRV